MKKLFILSDTGFVQPWNPVGGILANKLENFVSDDHESLVIEYIKNNEKDIMLHPLCLTEAIFNGSKKILKFLVEDMNMGIDLISSMYPFLPSFELENGDNYHSILNPFVYCSILTKFDENFNTARWNIIDYLLDLGIDFLEDKHNFLNMGFIGYINFDIIELGPKDLKEKFMERICFRQKRIARSFDKNGIELYEDDSGFWDGEFRYSMETILSSWILSEDANFSGVTKQVRDFIVSFIIKKEYNELLNFCLSLIPLNLPTFIYLELFEYRWQTITYNEAREGAIYRLSDESKRKLVQNVKDIYLKFRLDSENKKFNLN